jgi:hypothetical protein
MAIVFLTLCAVLYIGSTLHLPNVQWAQMSPVYSSISNARSRCLCFKFNYIQTFFHAFSDNFDECFSLLGQLSPHTALSWIHFTAMSSSTLPTVDTCAASLQREGCASIVNCWIMLFFYLCFFKWSEHVSACMCLHCIRVRGLSFYDLFWRFAAELRAFVVAVNLLVLSIGIKKEEFTSPGWGYMPHSFQSTTGIVTVEHPLIRCEQSNWHEGFRLPSQCRTFGS